MNKSRILIPMEAWIYQIVGFGFASFLSDFNHEMTVSFIPTIIGQFADPEKLPLIVGIITSLVDAASAFLRLGSGFISDKVQHKKPIIAFGYACSALFSSWMGYAHSLLQVVMLRIGSFMGSSLREPPRDALIAATVPPAYYGRAFGIKSAMDTLGSLVGPLVAFWCAAWFSTKQIFLLSAIPGLLAVVVIIWCIHEPPSHVINKNKDALSIKSLLADAYTLPAIFYLFAGIMFVFELAFFNKLMLLVRAQQVLQTAMIADAARWVIVLYALFNLARAIAEYGIGWLADRYNAWLLLAFFGCGFFVVQSILLMRSATSFGYLALVFIIAGIAMASKTTLAASCAARLLPIEHAGLGYGFLQALQGIGSLLSSGTIGFIWAHASPACAFGYAAVIGSSALVGLLCLSKR